jgi:CRP-like cAMP-binding protein
MPNGRATNVELPMREVRRRLSWVGFLAPLSETEMVALLRGASFVRLEEGEVMVVGPQEHAERVLLVVAGQLQAFEVSLNSERKFTLSVVGDGAAVGATGLVPRWTRDLHLRALELSLVCGVGDEELEAIMRANPEVGIRLARAGRPAAADGGSMGGHGGEGGLGTPGGAHLHAGREHGGDDEMGPMIPSHYTHTQLSPMVGSNRKAVTRAFAALQEVGAIEVKGRRIYVRDFDVLRRHAGE